MLHPMDRIPCRFALLRHLFATACAVTAWQGLASEVENIAAVSFDSHVVVLDANGTLDGFDFGGRQVAQAELKRLQLKGALNIGSGANRLYAATATAVYELNRWGSPWKKTATFAEHRDSLLRVAVVGDRPLLVYPTEIVDPMEPRTYEVPMSIGSQVHTRVLRLHASYGTPSILWLGTGHGEWGGHLMGLNPKTGEWVQYYDALNYVTGITSANSDHVIVSWSMSHFMASTLIRQHGINAQPDHEFPELKDNYYQTVTYSPFDHILYAIERKWLVTLTGGKPTRVIELTLHLFKPEPKAIGVAPGVIALLPVAEHHVVVVAATGVPVMVDTSMQKAVSFGTSVE